MQVAKLILVKTQCDLRQMLIIGYLTGKSQQYF
jgi:hypothetical protein